MLAEYTSYDSLDQAEKVRFNTLYSRGLLEQTSVYVVFEGKYIRKSGIFQQNSKKQILEG